jgi:hypothetical protein
MQKTKAPVDVMVIDKIEKPSPNWMNSPFRGAPSGMHAIKRPCSRFDGIRVLHSRSVQKAQIHFSRAKGLDTRGGTYFPTTRIENESGTIWPRPGRPPA